MGTSRKSKAAGLLAASGPFAKQFPGFVPREQQQTLAHAISHALSDSVPCLAEAGTGVGKTLAYLVPLLLWLAKNDGTTAVISTHTIALQTQLVEKDIPAVLSVLGLDLTYSVLKGRQNYLCHQEMDVAAADLHGHGGGVVDGVRQRGVEVLELERCGGCREDAAAAAGIRWRRRRRWG